MRIRRQACKIAFQSSVAIVLIIYAYTFLKVRHHDGLELAHISMEEMLGDFRSSINQTKSSIEENNMLVRSSLSSSTRQSSTMNQTRSSIQNRGIILKQNGTRRQDHLFKNAQKIKEVSALIQTDLRSKVVTPANHTNPVVEIINGKTLIRPHGNDKPKLQTKLDNIHIETGKPYEGDLWEISEYVPIWMRGKRNVFAEICD